MRLPRTGTRARPGFRAGRSSGRGAVAVEAAIVLPFLLFLICGMIDFGRMLNTQVQLDAAAREGARAASIGADPNARVQLVLARSGATTTANVAGAGDTACTADSPAAVGCVCPTGADATGDAAVTVTYTFRFVTPLGSLASLLHLADPDPDHGNGRPMTGMAVMSCVR